MSRDSFMQRYLYYALIFVLSLVMLCFLPMVGSEVGLEWDIPNTPAGWAVFMLTNTCSAFFNVMLFHFFTCQGKANIISNEKYIAANALLEKNKIRHVAKPRSPGKWHAQAYSKKGTFIFIFTVLGTLTFSQAILTWNLTKFLAQLITLVSGVIFGFMQMKTTETYWTVEYPEYAEMAVAAKKAAEEKAKETPVPAKPQTQYLNCGELMPIVALDAKEE